MYASLGLNELTLEVLALYILDSNLVITVPGDALAPNGARASAGTVVIEKLNMFFFSSFSNYQYFCITL